MLGIAQHKGGLALCTPLYAIVRLSDGTRVPDGDMESLRQAKESIAGNGRIEFDTMANGSCLSVLVSTVH